MPSRNAVNFGFWHNHDLQLRAFLGPLTGALQTFHAAVGNQLAAQRHLISRRTLRTFRTAAFNGWRAVVAA